jgi:hypothetical protein
MKTDGLCSEVKIILMPRKHTLCEHITSNVQKQTWHCIPGPCTYLLRWTLYTYVFSPTQRLFSSFGGLYKYFFEYGFLVLYYFLSTVEKRKPVASLIACEVSELYRPLCRWLWLSSSSYYCPSFCYVAQAMPTQMRKHEKTYRARELKDISLRNWLLSFP